ncbi:hypothetical protein BC936DRAFT_141800 [Jimgerdemannia flammicorona]|uniref:Uncharacterized protein n=1 Tax=Jimgerdemannia flammicorona TaxID=994334 RepID=A0A433A1M0_9FUNG|nr:hypothetical protein BC936DRAFT_141800 [Jimgerdemannia flammicorona]
MESYLPAGDAYNVLPHYDQEWCKPMGESKKSLLHDRTWKPGLQLIYTRNSLILGFEIQTWGWMLCGSSISSSNRKNRHRKLSDRKQMGHRVDGLILEIERRREFGAFEAALLYNGAYDTKVPEVDQNLKRYFQ